MILFNPSMETEKLAVIGLVVIIVLGLSAYILTTENVFENLFGEKEPEPVVVEPVDTYNFTRTSTLKRNVTLDITSPTPAEIVEEQLFAFLRIMDDDFTLSLNPYADETVYFEIDIVDVYNGSVEDVISSDKAIELGDCADVHYISRYSSDDSVFSSSYDDADAKTGGSPLKVFVHTSYQEVPPTNFSDYYSSVYTAILLQDAAYADHLTTPLAVKQGFVSALIGMTKGESKTTDAIAPENAYGSLGYAAELSILDIQPNQAVPPEFQLDVETTTMYILRDESHYLGEIVVSVEGITYSSWPDSSAVTKINDTHIWIYTTPTTDIGESFTWVSAIYDATNQTQTSTDYPTNTSQISTLDDDTIIITHNPKIGESISVIIDTYFGSTASTYNIVKITDDKITTVEVLDQE